MCRGVRVTDDHAYSVEHDRKMLAHFLLPAPWKQKQICPTLIPCGGILVPFSDLVRTSCWQGKLSNNFLSEHLRSHPLHLQDRRADARRPKIWSKNRDFEREKYQQKVKVFGQEAYGWHGVSIVGPCRRCYIMHDSW